VSDYEVQVGEFRGRTYFLLVSAEPSLNHVQSFAVVLYYDDAATEERVQIARIDTSHGYTHIDKLYTERQESEPLDVDVWEAHERLESNWLRYARLHRRNHE
jgi:hypothetical protein